MASGAGRSILLVAQLSPPSTLVAARRVAGMTKYLARLGYSITVLTSAVSGIGPIEGADLVIRTPDLLASRLNWRRRHLDAMRGRSDDTYRPPSRLESMVVPDLAVAGWLPLALPRARRFLGTRSVDCLITTSPPESAHLIARTVRKRSFSWIAELRDGWAFEPPRAPWPLALQRRLNERIERLVVREADAVVGVTKPIVDDLRSRLGVAAVTITNGFDPDDGLITPAGTDPLLAPGRHSIVHTGRMGAARSTPQPLLEALREIKETEPNLAKRLEVVFAGPLTEEERVLLAAPDLEGMVRVTGWLERPHALRLQREADCLLVITEGSTRRSVATGKLFEYLAAGKPILVLGEETEAARLVRETGTGYATSAIDSGAIAAALRLSARGGISRDPSETAVANFSWIELAGRYAELIEQTCSDKTRDRAPALP